MGVVKPKFTRRNMMQNVGNRRYVQKCAQNAGSNILKELSIDILLNNLMIILIFFSLIKIQGKYELNHQISSRHV